MSSNLFIQDHDAYLLDRFTHLNNYPVMLPFIGSKYGYSIKKILLLGESHYIPSDEIDDCFTDDWYNQNHIKLNDYYSGWINTRSVIERADDIKVHGFQKSFTIFYNVKNELKNHVKHLENEELVFPHISFYNYFQRPALVETESIINDENDNNIAYDTFKAVKELIKPDLVIFLSVKAYNSFSWLVDNRNEYKLFEDVNIDFVPHPSSAWWNKKSKKYAIKDEPLTGREKFIELIRD